MTRKQALQLAAELVTRAHDAGEGTLWTSVVIDLPPQLWEQLTENPSLVVECMPSGWKLGGQVGAAQLTVMRTLTGNIP